MTPKPNPPATAIGTAPTVQNMNSYSEQLTQLEQKENDENLKLLKKSVQKLCGKPPTKKIIRSAEDKLPPGFRPIQSASSSRPNSRAGSVEPIGLQANGPARRKSYFSELINSKTIEKSEFTDMKEPSIQKSVPVPETKSFSSEDNDTSSFNRESQQKNLNSNKKSYKSEKSDFENSVESDFSARCETVRNAIAAARIRTFGSEEEISNLRATSLQPLSLLSSPNLDTKSYTSEQNKSINDEESKQSPSGRSETVLNAIAAARARTFGTDDLTNFRSNSVEPISLNSNFKNRPNPYAELSGSSIGGTDSLMTMFRRSLTPTRSETVMNAIAAAKARTFGTDDISHIRSNSLEPTSLQSNQNIHPKYNFSELLTSKTNTDSNGETVESKIETKFTKNKLLTNEDIKSNTVESQSVFSKNFKSKLVSSKVGEESVLPAAGKPPKPPVPSHVRVARKPIKLLTNINVASKTSLEDDLTSPSITNPSKSSIINSNDSNKSILTKHQQRASSVDVLLKLPLNSSTSNNRSETVTAAIAAAKARTFGTEPDDMTTSYYQSAHLRNNRNSTDITNGLYSRESSVVRLTSRSPSPVSSISTISGYNNGPLRINNNHLPPKRPNNNSIRSTKSVSRSSSIQLQQQNNRATTPRRIFPQSYTPDLDIFELHQMEQSPVVFDANLSFVMGCNKQSIKQNFRPSPSHQNPQTASNHLTDKIANFLKRTDHVMDEWKTVGKRNSICCGDDTISLIERQRERSIERGESRLGRSKSSTNILIKGFQLAKNLPRTPRSRSSSIARDISSLEDDDDRTIHEDELSEMTVDLAEERSTSNISSERLEAETAERLKLEKELQEQQNKVKNLQETSEKLEMELICAKSDLNGISEDEDGENDDTAGGVYKLKYERVARELEFTKRRLQTQHEHDLEQLVGLKKQLEKKLADAYEEVEEQRQVVGQWKRKSQKMTNEQNDLRMLLEEQNGRNNLLEKKQRKFDLECQALQDATRQERQAKDRLAREKDVLIAEKFTLEQNLADTRLELDLKEEKVTALQRELEEMTFGGGTEEEVAQLRRSKMDMDRRLKEQEEELDEMAGQVQLLEQAKLRLEMTVETMRKEARREAQQRDDELEEARGSAYKKIKALECQLETEHEERTLLLREKHELERRLQTNEELERADRQAEEVANQKLRRDLRKYKALLKDAHAQLERLKADSPGKALIRQLRNQLEDAETARTISMKARQTAESELTEIQTQLDEAQRGKNEAEEKSNSAHRDRAELQAQIEENEEEMAELMKKYTTTVKQLNNEQSALSEYEIKISELEAERNSLKENIAELQARLENVENMSDPTAAVQSKRLELRAKELESRLELEQATKARLEVQSNRHKDALEKIQQEVTQSKMREMTAQDALKKSQKTLRELREEFHTISSREQESLNRRRDLEKKLETLEAETASLRNDLRLALQRIADLQQAMEEGDDDVTESESDSTDGSISDLEERLKPIQVKRTSINTNGVSDTKLVLRETSENSPRITITTPSTANISGDNLKNGDSSFA